MFELFTPQAIKVIMLAQEESRRLQHYHVGSEHILLGLLHGQNILFKLLWFSEKNLATRILSEGSLRLEDCRLAVEKIKNKGSGPRAIIELPFTENGKLVLQKTQTLMKERNDKTISPLHLLVGVFDTENCTALAVLESMGANTQTLREKSIQALNFEKENNRR